MKTTTPSIYPMRKKSVSLVVYGLALAATMGIAYSQSSGPTDSKGVSSKDMANVKLDEQIHERTGRQLRARQITIQPGGHVAAHSHKDRPTLEYVVEGNVVEIRNGVEVPHSAGEVVLATAEVNHWWENRSDKPAVLMPVDVYKP